MKRRAGASVFGYFWGNAKSDWPRAAMERTRHKRQCSFSKSKDDAHGERARYATALTLALSRAAGEGTDLRFARVHSLDPRFARMTPVGRAPSP